MSHPMDLSRMSRQEIIKKFRKLEHVMCGLQDWIENGGGVRFGKRCPMCMRIERLKVIKSCACYDADAVPCRCSTCRAEYSCDSGDSERGNVDDIEWWERDDPPDSLDPDVDARMKKKRMNMQPKKTSKPKKAKKPLKKHSEMSGPEVCGKIKHSVMTNIAFDFSVFAIFSMHNRSAFRDRTTSFVR